MVRGRPLNEEEKKEYDDKNRKRSLHLQRAQRALRRNDLFTYKQERKLAGLEEKGQKSTREALLQTAPTRPPPDRPDKIIKTETLKPKVETSVIVQNDEPMSKFKESSEYAIKAKASSIIARDLSQEAKQYADDTSNILSENSQQFISGSQVNKSLTSNSDDMIPNVYNDHITPESQISLEANDREEFKGANPRELNSEELKEIYRLRAEEYENDAKRVFDIVDEVELLSGGQNDSLMDATDLVDDNKHETDDDPRGHSKSGLDRGRDAHKITEINLEDMEASLNDFFMSQEQKVSDDLPSIGRRFGQSIPSYRDFSNDFDTQSMTSDADSIMSSISGLTDLSAQNGSWFSNDSDLDNDTDLTQRMSMMNKIPINKQTQSNIGKFNPMMNAGNRLLMSQGASLGTINEMRNKEINYKQPTRKIKNNGVNLIRLGNQTAIKINQEFDP